jgi:hypothetical protein
MSVKAENVYFMTLGWFCCFQNTKRMLKMLSLHFLKVSFSDMERSKRFSLFSSCFNLLLNCIYGLIYRRIHNFFLASGLNLVTSGTHEYWGVNVGFFAALLPRNHWNIPFIWFSQHSLITHNGCDILVTEYINITISCYVWCRIVWWILCCETCFHINCTACTK